MPKGIPNSLYGICDQCGIRYKLHGIKQKRCDACRIPARLEVAKKQSKLYYQKNKERIRISKRSTEAKRPGYYREMKGRTRPSVES